MKHLLYLLLVMVLLPTHAHSQSIDDFFGDMNNSGRDFWFSFPACYDQGGSGKNSCKIFVYSPVEQDITLEIPGRGTMLTKRASAQTVVEFELGPALAQPFTKLPNQEPPADQLWAGAAINVRANSPVCVQGITRFNFTSDGFTALPTQALGRDYVVSSYADMSAMYAGLRLPSELCIVGVEDNTTVQFTLGGNSQTETAGGLVPGQSISVTIDKGDVYAISTITDEGDLSGSRIVSNKPVGVVSGNQCANIPTIMRWCDYIVEMQSPVETWGTEYHVTKIHGRQKNSMMKVYAKEDNTTVYRNGQVIGTIDAAPGVEGVAFLHSRVADGDANHFTISADKPIYVTQFNPGQEDDNVVSDPFQLDLYSTSQYGKIAAFATPGLNGNGFSSNYVNLTYQSTNGSLPADLEYAIVNSTSVDWQPVSDVFGSTFGEAIGTNGMWWVREIPLPGDNVYAFRCQSDFGLVSYGFSNYDSYAFPAVIGTIWQGTEDNDPPMYTIVSEETNKLTIEFADTGSGVAFAVLERGTSPGVDISDYQYDAVTGKAIVEVDFANSANEANISFLVRDRAGNATTIDIDGEVCSSGFAELVGMGELQSLHNVHFFEPRTLLFEITNPLDKAIILSDVWVNGDSQFSLVGPETISIASQETYTFEIAFSAVEEARLYSAGVFVADSCDRVYELAFVEVDVEAGEANHLGNLSFPLTEIGSKNIQVAKIQTTSDIPVKVHELSVFSTNGEFSLEYDTSQLPFKIYKDKTLDIPIAFVPQQHGKANGILKVETNASTLEILVELEGEGVVLGVEEQLEAIGMEVNIHPHPATVSSEIVVTSAQPRAFAYGVFSSQGKSIQGLRQIEAQTAASIPLPKGLASGQYTFVLLVDGIRYSIPFIVE